MWPLAHAPASTLRCKSYHSVIQRYIKFFPLARKALTHQLTMSSNRFNYLCILLAGVCLLGISSCKTPKDIVYFQDIQSQTSFPVSSALVTIKPNDRLNIIVNARDPQVTDALNLPYVTRQLGNGSLSSYNQGVVAYNVDSEGNIDFPYLGAIHLGGLTRTQAAALVKEKLNTTQLAIDPVVTVDIINAQVAVLGEVTKPGRYDITSDDMTLLDILGAAGDLTILGERTNVRVLRKNGSTQDTYIVNLLNAEELAQSPAYYVQQDDVVYVEPNKTRIRQSTTNGNTVLSTSFWISIASMAITLAAVIFR